MIKHKFLPAVALLMGLSMQAAPVSVNQARQQARQFMAERGISLTTKTVTKAPRQGQTTTEESSYYIFNADAERGFVVISGDDRTPSVLGYTDKGHFDMENMPEGLKWLLQNYEEQITAINKPVSRRAEKDEAGAKPMPQPAKHNIAPLMTTTWNQGGPYNDLCPRYIKGDGTEGDHSATGCVATAIAQVINYYRHPDALLRAIPSYTLNYDLDNGGKKTITVQGIRKGTTIDWDNMLDNYNGSETEEQKTAIAQLMYYVGVGCKMGYGPSSGAGYPEGVKALINNFGFDDGAHIENRGNHTIESWANLLYNELATGHPIAFAASNSGGAHAFVLDGYDTEGLYHVNWGWGGLDDGYFRIDVMAPDNNSGIGASATPDGYNMGQDAIIGLRLPDDIDAPQEQPKLTVNDWEIRSGNKFFANYVNWSGVSTQWDMAIGYVNKDGDIVPIGNKQSNQLGTNYYVGLEFTISGLEPGTYHIVPISKRSAVQDWQTHVNPDIRYLQAEVAENGDMTLSLHPVEDVTVTGITFPGNHKVNENQPIFATFKNNADEYYREIHVLVSQTEDKGESIGRTAVTMTEGGETVASFIFKPEKTGTWNVWLSTDNRGNNIVGQATVNITTEGVKKERNLRYVSHSITNKSNNVIYGNRMQGKVSIINQAQEAYDDNIRLWLFKLASNGYFYGANSVYIPVHIEPSETKQVSFDFDNLDLGATYNMSIIYGDSEGGDINDGGLKSMGNTQAGVMYWTAANTLSGTAPKSSFTVPTTAVAVDMSSVGNVMKTVRPNSNPNTLYFASENIKGLESSNLIINNEADKICLIDGYNFLSPRRFKAKEVEYKRLPASSKWDALTLPFEVSSIPSRVIAKTFTKEENGKAYFESVDKIEAGVPHVIYTTKTDSITFSATDATILSTTTNMMSLTNNYQFIGTTAKNKQKAGIMIINEEGTAFVPTTDATQVNAFRAWLVAPEDIKSVEIGMEEVLGITSFTQQLQLNIIFDLQGRRVVGKNKGIYIQNGKKYIVK